MAEVTSADVPLTSVQFLVLSELIRVITNLIMVIISNLFFLFSDRISKNGLASKLILQIKTRRVRRKKSMKELLRVPPYS